MSLLTPEQRIQDVLSRLEMEAQTFRVPEGTSGYEGVWTPNGYNEYWQVPRTTGLLLYALAHAHRASSILEIGTSVGYSTIWLAMATQQHDGHITTVEMAPAKAAMAANNIAAAGFSAVVDIVVQPAGEFLQAVNGEFDFVFLDADKSNYLSYFQRIEPRLARGGLIVADNAKDYRELMVDFIDYIASHRSYEGTVYEVDNGVLVYRKLA